MRKLLKLEDSEVGDPDALQIKDKIWAKQSHYKTKDAPGEEGSGRMGKGNESVLLF